VSSETGIWRAAMVMVKRCGADAMLQASERADQLRDEGDMVGAETWPRILNAISGCKRRRRRTERGRMN
jgi:hypothetical protein